MPHDAKGQLIQVGDEVIIRGKVTYVGTNPEDQFCNCTVETLIPMPAYPGVGVSFSQLNTKMVEKVPTVVEG